MPTGLNRQHYGETMRLAWRFEAIRSRLLGNLLSLLSLIYDKSGRKVNSVGDTPIPNHFRMKLPTLILTTAFTMGNVCLGTGLFVAPNGAAGNPGTSALRCPESWKHATTCAKRRQQGGATDDVRIVIRQGDDFLSGPVELTAADGGSGMKP